MFRSFLNIFNDCSFAKLVKLRKITDNLNILFGIFIGNIIGNSTFNFN